MNQIENRMYIFSSSRLRGFYLSFIFPFFRFFNCSDFSLFSSNFQRDTVAVINEEDDIICCYLLRLILKKTSTAIG